MAGENGTSHMGNVYHYYKCGRAKRRGKEHCDLRAICKEPLERFVVDTALKVIFNTESIDTCVDSVYIFDDRVVLNFKDTSKIATREEILGSTYAGNDPPKQMHPNFSG